MEELITLDELTLLKQELNELKEENLKLAEIAVNFAEYHGGGIDKVWKDYFDEECPLYR